MATVTFDGTQVDNADADTNWNAWGAAVTEEPDYYYQGAGCISCLVKTAEVGFYLIDPGGTVDFSTTARTVIFKVIQTNYTAIDSNGLQLYIGNDDSNHSRYEIFSAATYPATGGFQVVCIDPNKLGYVTATVGTVTLTAIDFYGVQSDASVQAKAPNLGLDTVDYVENGTGLTLTGTSGTFTTFIDFDYTGLTSRTGIVTVKDGILYVNAVLTIGSATLTEFSDSNTVLVFPDHRVDTGYCGMDVDLQNASTSVTIASCTFNGRGSKGADGASADTRPVFEVSGTSGSASFNGCSFLSHNQVIFTEAASMSGGRIEAQEITQDSADISDVTIVTDSATGVATIDDVTFGSTTDLHDIDFVQGGDGHALELQTAASYTLTNITFTSYGADTTDSAAILVSATTGTATLNISGGDQPTYKSSGATVNIVLNPVSTTVVVQDIENQQKISGATILCYVADGGNYDYLGTVASITQTAGTATVTHAAHSYSSNDFALIRGASDAAGQFEFNGSHEVTVVDSSVYTYIVASTLDSAVTAGTITSTFVLLDTTADGSGEATMSKTWTTNQTVTGNVRAGSSGFTYLYKPSTIVGAVDKDGGVTITIPMSRDE